MKCSLGSSNFLEELPSLSHSVVFISFFALIAEEGFLISPCYSSELCIRIDISFVFSFAFSFSSFLSYFKACQTTILPFCISFSWGWSWFLSPIQCHELPSRVLAWRIPGTEEPGRRTSMGSHRIGHDWSDLAAAVAGNISCKDGLDKGQKW